ncbi:MAG: dTMP kinase [Bacteroidales bacterium]|nr:dTMP kinase [Bacteroidales bacterium]
MSFIVIEGLDGSGKSTQVKMLRNYLEENKISNKYVHFPIVESPYFGDLVARFLRGDFGGVNEVNPYLVALIFAGNRYNAKQMIENWLESDFLVLSDRYVHSNIGFQCAKLKDKEEIKELYNWILGLEYDYFKIPKPDLSIFLDVPIGFVKQKLSENRDYDDRDYLQGKADIHEADIEFQKKVRNTYLYAVESDKSFAKIDCFDEAGSMLPPDDIFSKIISLLREKNIL